MAIYVYKEIEINEEDLASEDLIREMSRRNLTNISPNVMIEVLINAGCPRDILEPVMDWWKNNRKIVTQKDLARWTAGEPLYAGMPGWE